MYKCIKIIWHIPCDKVESILLTTIQHAADVLSVEGTLYAKDSIFEIIAAGEKQAVDDFIDEVYRIIAVPQKLGELEIVAAAKERDYRGVFRIMI